MALVAIGSVAISHGDPSFSSATAGRGVRSRTIGGSCSWAAALTLDELVPNEAARTTVKGHTGVLEWLEFDDALIGAWTGNYILESFVINASQKDSLTTADCPFTLTAAYVD